MLVPALIAVAALVAIGIVLVDVFSTIVLARRTRQSFRITRVFYILTWKFWAWLGLRIESSARREAFLSIYGPLSLLVVIGLWAAALVFAFGLLQWSAGQQPAHETGTLLNDIYFSALTFFTLSMGDPRNAASKFVTADDRFSGRPQSLR